MSYQYKSQPFPEFNGKDYSGYPDWKREWQLSVSVGKSAVWIITHLNKSTPSWVNLSGCTTVDECWQELDLHFANPMAVSTELMSNFEKFRPEGNEYQKIVALCDQVAHLHRSLKTVKQEEMLENSMFMLNKIILMIPKSYQNDFSRQRSLQNKTNRTVRGVLNATNGLDDMSAKDLFSSIESKFCKFDT